MSTGPAVDPKLVIAGGTHQLHKFNFLKSKNDSRRLQCNADDAARGEVKRTCLPDSRRN